MGKNCQFESDPCNPSECLNGGSCTGNTTHFRYSRTHTKHIEQYAVLQQ